jgi:hypothetical protein
MELATTTSGAWGRKRAIASAAAMVWAGAMIALALRRAASWQAAKLRASFGELAISVARIRSCAMRKL